MINFDYYTNDNKSKYNPKGPYIPDHFYKLHLVGGQCPGKQMPY